MVVFHGSSSIGVTELEAYYFPDSHLFDLPAIAIAYDVFLRSGVHPSQIDLDELGKEYTRETPGTPPPANRFTLENAKTRTPHWAHYGI